MRVDAELAVGDCAEAERVEVPYSDVAAKEDGVCRVQIDDLEDQSADVEGVGAAEPTRSTDGDVLCVFEHDVAVFVGVARAVKCASVDEAGRAGRTMRREEFVDEGCSAVEQDGLGSKEEVGVRGHGVLVAVELVLGHDALVICVAVDDVGLVASVVGKLGHLGEVGAIECVVVAEEEIGAG